MKLIDKDRLMVEIEKIIADETESIKSFEHSKNSSELQRSNARIGLLEHIHSILNTLEVQSPWHDAQGADLPELDREVIALLTNGKVVFAHRPKESWTGKTIDTGELTLYYPERYDKGGWNQPDVKYWLDCELPDDAKYWFDYELPYMED